MGGLTQRIAKQSLQLHRADLKPISSVALVTVILVAAANGIDLQGRSPEASRSQSAETPAPEFYVELSTVERDQPGLNTLIVAGPARLMFDCEAVDGTVARGPTALFLTALPKTTANGPDRRCRDTLNEPPLRIWGPRGTRPRMFETVGDRVFETKQPPFLNVIDVQEGIVSEIDNVSVVAIETDPATLAYRVRFNGVSVLIASDVIDSDHLGALAEGVDVAVLRHSDVMETIKLLQRITPRLAVLSPDGRPATMAQIRTRYRGPVRMLSAGTHRIHVHELASLDRIKVPQR